MALLVVVAAAFVRGRRPGDGVAAGRFWAGLAVVAVALLSPISTYGEALLSVHMVQHLLLAFVAAPLLASSGAGVALLAALPPSVAGLVRRVGSSRLARSPLLAWAAFAGAGWVIHFSPLFDLALRQPVVHAFEHALFLGTGVWFWWPVVAAKSRLSHPVRLLYVALGMPQNTFLALAIFSAGHPLYEAYEQLGRAWGPSLLDDQRLGGGIMWVAGDLTLLAAVLTVAAAWATREMAATSEE